MRKAQLIVLFIILYSNISIAQVQFNARNITAILQDNNNDYWIGTSGEGLYHISKNNIINYNSTNGLKDNEILSLEEALNNSIIVKTAKGTNYYESSSWYSIKNDEIILPKIDSDKVYLSSKIKLISPYYVYTSLKDSKNNLWYGTHYLGVCKFDGNTYKWYMSKGLKGPAVRAIFEDHLGNIWIGNNGQGLYKLHADTLVNITEKYGLGNTNFQAKHQLKDQLKTMARVFAISEDNNGNLWIGTVDAGVWKYDGKVFKNYDMSDGLPTNTINVIYKNKKGEMLFGTTEQGVYRFNGFAFYKTSF